MGDETESLRRELVSEVNSVAGARAALEDAHGQVWDTEQLADAFEVSGFAAPFVVVRRKADGVRGSLMFQHNPRFYFCFVADR
jgi:hypothetical protein